ncbi:oxidoreductase [Streptomyces viridochromogenes]|uniref:Oxidoreductase n=1 Tax=Streptomyces viridochromogenes TaxID=1938 RepID=A0A0L8L475_STRVR|nr:oxidoreductase [Streptomyces viridochromogenes]
MTRAPQYVEYLPGNGHFHRHNDYSHDQTDSPRKITVIVQLSDASSYEGGGLQMFGVDTEELPRERGSVLVFPSLIDHRVTPVTQGLRRALVAWVAGPRLR